MITYDLEKNVIIFRINNALKMNSESFQDNIDGLSGNN